MRAIVENITMPFTQSPLRSQSSENARVSYSEAGHDCMCGKHSNTSRWTFLEMSPGDCHQRFIRTSTYMQTRAWAHVRVHVEVHVHTRVCARQTDNETQSKQTQFNARARTHTHTHTHTIIFIKENYTRTGFVSHFLVGWPSSMQTKKTFDHSWRTNHRNFRSLSSSPSAHWPCQGHRKQRLFFLGSAPNRGIIDSSAFKARAHTHTHTHIHTHTNIQQQHTQNTHALLYFIHSRTYVHTHTHA
jgi:hypothetical protein